MNFKLYIENLGTIDKKHFLYYKIDNENRYGLSLELAFKNSPVSQVDYFIQYNNNVYLIGLSDLHDDIRSSQNFTQILKKPPKKTKEIVILKTWRLPLFFHKLAG